MVGLQLPTDSVCVCVCVCVCVRAVPEIILEGAQTLFCPVGGGCFVDNVSEGWGGNLSWGSRCT